MTMTEDDVIEATEIAIHELLDAAAPIWHRGDGEGGYVMTLFARICRDRGIPGPSRNWTLS